jgi:hypothetical protein
LPQGEYFVRITETSAVVETLITHEIPVGDSWAITKFIASAHEEVVWHEGKIPPMERRIKELVSRPKIRNSERQACFTILNSKTPEEIVATVTNLMNEVVIEEPFKPIITTHDPEVDIVSVHRLAFEQLNRLAVRTDRCDDTKFANACIDFIRGAMERFKNETDVIVMGLRFISDIMASLVLFKLQLLHLLLDCVQRFSPPPHMCRPRSLKRLDKEMLAMLERELEVKREEDRRIREEFARLAEEARLLAEEIARRKKEEEDEIERLRLEEEAKQEKFRRKIAKAKAKQQKALGLMWAQGIKPEIPVRTLEETRQLR